MLVKPAACDWYAIAELSTNLQANALDVPLSTHVPEDLIDRLDAHCHGVFCLRRKPPTCCNVAHVGPQQINP